MRRLSGWFLAAFLLSVLAGCGGGGGIEPGVPKDAGVGPPPPTPGMDLMKEKMTKKRR